MRRVSYFGGESFIPYPHPLLIVISGIYRLSEGLMP